MENNDFAVGYAMGDSTANRNNNCGWGNNGMWGMEWIFALLILPMMWGNGGFFGNNRGGNPVTEADLCQSQSFAELKNSVGRGFDQQTQFAFQNQRDLCTSTATLSAQIAAAAAAAERCCCGIEKELLENRYLAERNTASTNATIIEQVQSVKDMLCQQEAARKDARIWQLELNQAFCGVPRFQPGTVYGSIPVNPFFGFGNGCGCNSCGCGNI